MRYTMLISIAMLYCIHLQGQKYWDGDGGDSQWFTAANWTNNTLPSPTDNVILDNSIVKNTYMVNLPAANSFNSSFRITVKSLTISPATGNIITCVIPLSNKLSPALSTPVGSGYGLVINNSGVFLNSSGAGTSTSPVNSLDIKDSIKINNGGKYIHNTLTRHLNIVPILSKTSGTENGTFEFDVPMGTADLSLLNITYGNLVLSGTAANLNRTYTTPGSGGNVIVNGNLIINTGVRLDVNFMSPGINTIIVKGNLQNEGTFNLANSTGMVTLKVVGNMAQLSNGQLVKFGPGAASIELNGISTQNIMLSGLISGNITFIMNNPAGAALLAPLSLPYMLILQNGQITTSSANLLTLQDMCTLQVTDSMSSNSFINGPLRKTGLTNGTRFLFPVGKNNMHRWLELRNAYGSYKVEYIRSNPHDLCLVSQSGIDHISGVEYWKVTADASPAPAAVVKLSFDNVNSGGITDLSALRVARLKSGTTYWANLSNSETAGTAGTRGYVTAFTTVTDFDNINGDFFTLATSNPSHPLPLKDPIQESRQEAQKRVLFTKLLHTNPSIIQGTTLLTVLAEKEEPVRIALINKMGQPVRVQQFFLNKGNNKLMLDLSGLASGIYQITGYTADRSTNTIRCIKL